VLLVGEDGKSVVQFELQRGVVTRDLDLGISIKPNNCNVLFIGQIDYCHSVVVLESITRYEAPQALYKRSK
jgi:hypothetical protein